MKGLTFACEGRTMLQLPESDRAQVVNEWMRLDSLMAVRVCFVCVLGLLCLLIALIKPCECLPHLLACLPLYCERVHKRICFWPVFFSVFRTCCKLGGFS